VRYNAAGQNPHINFGGFMVGNPFTDSVSNNYGAFTTFYGHQLVDKPLYDEWVKVCPADPAACLAVEVRMDDMIGDVNPYALDYPVCLTTSKAKAGRAQRTWLLNHILPEERKRAGRIPKPQEYQPCIDNYVTQYLNNASVQQAIHARPTNWVECSSTILYNAADSLVPMEPLYQDLISNYSLHILVYSGDDDSVCATSGSQAWIYDLGYPVTKPWISWTDGNGQVGGYIIEFKGFNFVTVHTAGHEVPTYEPMRALEVFTNYIQGIW